MDRSSAAQELTLLALPVDLVAIVAGFLGEADFGRFRQTCRLAAEVTPVLRAFRQRTLPIGWAAVAETVREAARRGFVRVLAVFCEQLGFAALAPASFLLKLAAAAAAGRRDLVAFVADNTAVTPAQAVEAAQAAAACGHTEILGELCARAGPDILRACWRGACARAPDCWPKMVAFLVEAGGFTAADWAGPVAGQHAAVEIAAETGASLLLESLAARGLLAATPAALAAGLNTAAGRGHARTVSILLALMARADHAGFGAAAAAAASAAAVAGRADVLEALAAAVPITFAQVESAFESVAALPSPAVLSFFATRESAATLCGAGFWILRLAASCGALDVLGLLWPAVVADTNAQKVLCRDARLRRETRKFAALCRNVAEKYPHEMLNSAAPFPYGGRYGDMSRQTILCTTSLEITQRAKNRRTFFGRRCAQLSG